MELSKSNDCEEINCKIFQLYHMSELIHYQIQQLVDNGQTVQLSLVEDVQTEPVSQKQTHA